MSLMQSALARHTLESLGALLAMASKTDGSIKGFADGNPWDNLEDLMLALARPSS